MWSENELDISFMKLFFGCVACAPTENHNKVDSKVHEMFLYLRWFRKECVSVLEPNDSKILR